MVTQNNKTSAVRFSVIGINHNHIYSQIGHLLRAGAEFVSFYAPEPELIRAFKDVFPDLHQAREAKEILEDEQIDMVVTAGINNERAPLGIEAMRHGKDFMTDKPGFTTLDQLTEARQVQAETGRIYSICFSERFENRATLKAGEIVHSGAIGEVVQTIGLGSHQVKLHHRLAWFYQRARFGGILTDIASHQVDQFLYFTGAKSTEVVTSQVGNYNHPEYPEFEDFGQMVLRSERATGYIRVDWLTPDGLGTWGDGRLFILGTQGFIEIRKHIDLAGRPGGDHLFLVDDKTTTRIDCSDVELIYGKQLVSDVINRTETAMSQDHCFLASELALIAEDQATHITGRIG